MSESKRQNYHIISLIGKGAYGEVYKARKKQTGQFVAIKTIKKKGKQEKDIKAMREEISILKKLKHPNIVVLLDSFETNSEFIIVTELGQGELFNIIEDDQYLEQNQIRKVAQQLIRALHYIHSNRITHRDLKPQNVLMTSQGNIKLCDFGFARHMSYKTEVLTSLKGTPLYMAPEVVQQQPYNHTADLWSLGVILYELATGSPPFSAANLLTLVEHISKDPVRYPDVIQGDFKNLLKGLLNKDPTQRLGWPDLLNHPFIRQTEQQKMQRKMKTDKFSNWIDENHYIQDQQSSNNVSAMAARSLNQTVFDDRSRQVSPHKGTSASFSKAPSCNDPIWNNYAKMANDEKGASHLRVDAGFLDKLLTVLSVNVGELIRNKQHKTLLQCSLRVLTQVLMKSKTPQNKNFDISKKLSIPNYLLGILKSMVKLQGGKNYVDIISDITKLIGLLAKITFNKTLGIEMVYIRSFIPLFPSLLSCSCAGTDTSHQTLTINLLRTIGIFANNASVHHLRSFSFYKDVVEIKFIPQFLQIFKVYSNHLNVLKLLVQVISAFMHPVYGDIQFYPWKRLNFNGITQYKECSTMLDCVRQSIINGILQLDWIGYFSTILNVDEQNMVLPKISIERVVLQSIRQSKQFAQNLLMKPNPVLRYIFSSLTNTQPVIYGTTCLIVSHILKYIRDKKREADFIQNQYLTGPIVSLIFSRYLQCTNLKHGNNNNSSLQAFGSLVIIQELVFMGSQPFSRILEYVQSQKFFKICCDFLSNSEKNKLQEMRKLEGSNYGIHSVGFYDPLFLSLYRLLIRAQRQSRQAYQDLLKHLAYSEMNQKIGDIVTKISSKTDLSPKGMIAMLMLVDEMISVKIPNQFAQVNFLRNLISLLTQSQLECLIVWPINLGGGQGCLHLLLGKLMSIFLKYLQHAEKQPQILKIIYQQNLLQSVIQFSKYLNSDSIIGLITFIVQFISFNSQKLPFTKQFIEASGMALFVRFNLLKLEQYQPSSVLQACNLLSQIARSSKDTYQAIDGIDPYSDIKSLLNCQEIEIKSRVLNLIGNMCRYSSFFYEKLVQYNLLKEIIYMCNSDDKVAKKYACIALGNAGFHDSSLYPHLKMAIPILVGLLKDSDEKTRSNAAAALGNLVRNSDELDQQFVSTGANYQLVNMIVNDKALAARKVSIMAITNLLGLKQSSKLLKSLNIETILAKWVPPAYNGDQGIIKSAQRALDKLK